MDMIVTIGKSGNKYTVYLWHNTTHRGINRIFDTIDKAFELFALMSKYFVYGLYSINDRFEIFESWGGNANET